MKQPLAKSMLRLKRPGMVFALAVSLLLTFTAALPAAQETPAPVQPVTYPGLEEFTPRLTALAAKAVDADQRITDAEQVLNLEP